MFIEHSNVEISGLEVYRNGAYDLLNSRSSPHWCEMSGFKLKSVILIPGQVDEMIQAICKERVVKKTLYNNTSSLGHEMFFF